MRLRSIVLVLTPHPPPNLPLRQAQGRPLKGEEEPRRWPTVEAAR